MVRRKAYCLVVTAFIIEFFLLSAIFLPGPVLAGKASTGELLFYPCTQCHPTGIISPQARPNQFKGHQIELIGHDKLGSGKDACIVCHDLPTRNPGMLKLVDGSLINITDNISLVCYRCHSNKYKDWKAGMHGEIPLEIDGRYGENTKCTAKGCHDPHTPQWIAISPILPFLDTTIERPLVGPERVPFKALPGPPPIPKSPTFLSLNMIALFGFLIATAAVAGLIFTQRRKK